MFLPENLNDPAIQRLVRTANAGEYLFRQGEKGNTLFLIMVGTVTLQLKTMTGLRRVGTVGPGEMVGEKALVEDNPYRHTYSALAQTDVKMLELDRQNLKLIQGRIPDFTLKLLRHVTERLDGANSLISILLLKDEAEKITEFLLYFCHHHCKKSASGGLEVSISVDEIHESLGVDRRTIEACLSTLESQKILTRSPSGFKIADENALISFLPTLKERIAA